MESTFPIWHYLAAFFDNPVSIELWESLARLVPFVLFFELPVFALVLMGIVRHHLRRAAEPPHRLAYFPHVTCTVSCYSEGEAVAASLRCLAEQLYPGRIDIIAVIDGAARHGHTLRAARLLLPAINALPNRRLLVVPKWQRGGRVSSLNAGLALAQGEVFMALDGDTSFDNTMVERITRHFADASVAGVAGALRVRNRRRNLITRMQALEYLLSIHATKTAFSQFNLVNNISGAFGCFRTSMLRAIGGWDSGTAEDLDATLRLKHYFRRYRLRILFDPEAVGHTDVPETVRGLFQQRLRWDGDLFYLYLRKHRLTFQRRLLGWRNFVLQLWTGLMFQLCTPILIACYTAWILIVLPVESMLGVLLFIYLFYLVLILIQYAAFVLLVSERPREDLGLLPMLPLFSVYAFAQRLVSAFAILWEMMSRSHLDSAMAPWWVLCKTKY